MNVSDVMTKQVFCVGCDQSLNDAAQLMWEHDCGSVPVVDGDNLVVSMITDRDIAMAAHIKGDRLADIPLADVQSEQLVCCKADDDISEAQRLMQGHQLHRIPVVDEQSKPVGIVSLNDLARACQAGSKGITPKDISDTMAAICGSMLGRSKPGAVAAA